MARYAISDIHGCLKSFNALLKKINYTIGDNLYLLGDYIDRGPNSKGVIDYILQLQNENTGVECLKGNHEWMFEQAIGETIPYVWDWHKYETWVKNGGGATMKSFGYKRIDDLKTLESKYSEFIFNLKPYIELDNYYLVHAGFNFDAEDIFKDEFNMYWIRNWYSKIDSEKIKNKVIVHGHVPRSFELLQSDLKTMNFPAINIDCGCVFKMHEKLGKLSALNIDTLEATFQENIE